MPKIDRASIAFLKSLELTECLHHKSFDDLIDLATTVTNCETAYISLLNEDGMFIGKKSNKQWIKKNRKEAICNLVVEYKSFLEICDLKNDQISINHTFTKEKPQYNFYAGEPIINSQGDIIGALCVVDTVCKKLSENQIQALKIISKEVTAQLYFIKQQKDILQAKERFEMFFNSSPVAMTINTTGEGYVVNVNDAYTQLFGIKKEDLIGKSPLDLGIATLNDYELLNQSFVGDKVERLELSFKNSKHELIPCLVSVQKIIMDNEIYFLSSIEDISHLKDIEKKLIQSRKKAERLSLIKDRFLANMSHEIRTPLNAIVGFIQRLSKTDLNYQQTDYLNSLHHATENLLSIVNDILDFSAIEEGKIKIVKKPFEISDILNSMYYMFNDKARDKGIKLMIENFTDNSQYYIGDKDRLQQILINVLSNAIKFTDTGYIKLSVYEAMEIDKNIFLQFRIEDTGIGIPKNKISKIFNRFEQFHTDITKSTGGTGLGLSITKKLVEIQQGTIQVQSTEGEGSVFSLLIPYEIGESIMNVKSSTVYEKKQYSKLNYSNKILLVEDNVLNIKLLSLFLQDWGLSFDVAESGKNAIDLLKKQMYDLVLLDIQMPDINGFDVAKFIRKKLKFDTPIVAISAHVLEDQLEKSFSVGINDYVSKPIDEKKLYSILKKYAVNNLNNALKITNLDYINNLSTGREDFKEEIIHLFYTETQKNIQNLHSSLQNKDYSTIYQLAHKMKSNTNFIGIESFVNPLIQELEKMASSKEDTSKIQQQISNIEEIFIIAFNELKIEHSSALGLIE